MSDIEKQIAIVDRKLTDMMDILNRRMDNLEIRWRNHESPETSRERARLFYTQQEGGPELKRLQAELDTAYKRMRYLWKVVDSGMWTWEQMDVMETWFDSDGKAIRGQEVVK